MSARDMFARGAAASAVLSSMRRRSDTAARRSRWPGTTQFASNNVAVHPATYGYPAAVVWEDLLSLDLDAGAWFLLCNLRVIPASSSGSYQRVKARVGSETVVEQAAQLSDLVNSAFNLQTHATILLPSRSTMKLEIFSQADSPAPYLRDTIVESSSLLAFPL